VKNYDIEYIYYKYIYIYYIYANELLQECHVEIFLVLFYVRPFVKGRNYQSIYIDYSCRFLARHARMQE